MPSTQHILSPLTLALATVIAAPAVFANSNSANLGKTVVTASGFEQQVKDAPASISVLTQEELAKKSYRDVTDALKDVPGVVVTGGGSSSDISIRGMSSGYTLILVDGKRMNSRETRPNSDGSGIEQGWLPPIEAIERIEVVRGPMSSLYGSDAMGGVINIITKKVGQEWHGSVRSEATFQDRSDSGNYSLTNAYLSGPLVDGILGLDLYAQKADRQEDERKNGYAQQKQQSGTAKLSFTPNENNDFIFEYGRTKQERNSHVGKSIEYNPKATRPQTNSYNDYERTNVSLTYTGRWDGGITDNYLQREKIENPGRQMTIKNTVFNSQTTLFLGDHTATVGGQYKYEDLFDNGNQMPSAKDKNKLTRWSWSLFAEDEWRIVDSFALTSGLRLDRDENFGSHWSPRLYGVWNPLEQWTFKGGISTGYKTPSLRAAMDDWGQITGGGGDPAVIKGNSQLKPEKSVTTEFGFIWDNQENISTGLTIFQTDFKDKISEVRDCMDTAGNGQAIVTGNCTVGPDQFKFISLRENVDKAQMRGVEATFDWRIIENVKLAANYTFTHSEQKSGNFKGKPLNQMPRHMFNTTLDWDVTDTVNTWARVNYRGKTSDYLSRTSMGKATPAYTFLDLGVNYKVSKNLSLMGGIYNLGNKTIDYDKYNTVLDGRRYQVGATVTF